MKQIKSKSIALISGFLLLFSYFANSQVTDKDGNTYKTFKIGNKEWLSENLNVSHFSNGVPIAEARNEEEWRKAADEGQPAWCYYNYDKKYGKKYGKLYNWYAVNDQRGLAPQGWHIPNDSEWIQLTDKHGGENNAGLKLKSKEGWKENGNGTNESGFFGLPGGMCYSTGLFEYAGNKGFWWTSSSRSSVQAWCRDLSNNSENVRRVGYRQQVGFSVRCIKD